MKHYFAIVHLLLYLCFLGSCNYENPEIEIMCRAEHCMSESPESAIELLKSIDSAQFVGQKYHARYSLLYSMALDKCHIDIASDSIITPAVNYYCHRGASIDKLLTLYYWGRIAMNAGDYETALERFVKAESYASHIEDKTILARLYKAQAKVYQYCYDTHNMIRASQLAAENYRSENETAKYVSSLLDVVSGYMQQDDSVNALEYLNLVKQQWDHLSKKQKSAYFGSLLLVNENAGPVVLNPMVTEYLDSINVACEIQWLPVAQVLYKLNDYGKAVSALESYLLYGGKKNAAYYLIDANVSKAMGKYLEASESYNQYIELTGERNGYLFEADIRFVEERHRKELSILRRNMVIAIVTLCLMISALVLVIIANRVRLIRAEKVVLEHEKDKYLAMYKSTQTEIQRLECTLQNNFFDEAIKERIVKRLHLLNTFLLAHVTSTYSKEASDELRILLDDKDSFTESANLFFSIAHPKFFKYLKELNLTEVEIGYCCLYLMGLRGKDISSFMGNKHYKYSSNVRKKFGLTEHDTNLSLFLQKIFKEICY